MAGPGRRGDNEDTPEAQIAVAREREKVIAMVLAGASYKKVGEITGYSVRQVGRIVLAERARQFEKKPFAEHRAMIWARLEEMLESLRPTITGEASAVGGAIPSAKDVASSLAVLDRMTRLVGADAPRRSEVVTALELPQNEEALEYAKRVATRARLSNVVTVEPTVRTELEAPARESEKAFDADTAGRNGDVA